MQKSIKFIILSIFVVIIYTGCEKKVQGELFSRSEADQKFGSVLVSVKLPSEIVKDLLTRTNNYIMLRIVNDSVSVLDEKRNSIYPTEKSINSEDVYTLFSVSVMNELLSKGEHLHIYVEQRNKVLTISYGDNTLEFGSLCPPFCWND